MAVFYFDASGILKRYKTEKGSDVIDELIDQRKAGETFASSLTVAVEAFSVASRKLKGNEITQAEYDSLTSRFLTDFTSQFQIAAVDNSLMVSAITTAINHRLRTLDAIHFATIQRIRQIAAGAEEVIVIVSDQDLVDACRAEGIRILNPEDDGALAELRRLRQ